MTEPPFPARVRVGYRPWRIEALGQRASHSRHAFGECSYPEQVLRVCTDLGPAKTANTLLHELLHATFDLVGFNDVAEPTEEFLVTSTANVLSQIMYANPELRAWLAWAWAQED